MHPKSMGTFENSPRDKQKRKEGREKKHNIELLEGPACFVCLLGVFFFLVI